MTRASAVDPSLKLARRATQWSAATSFFETLRRNTNITRDEKIAPKQIDLVEGALVQPVEKPPIFIFVIDSLRQDYVGAYNPAVRFSPQIDAFAKDSLLWKNAFTAYGATGLSEPSIWAGSLLIHRQYVTPFAPMNSLERLVDALGYRKFMTVDAIVDELWTKGPDLTDIDEKTPGFYSLCESLKHVEERLDSAAPDRPVFVYSQPQDVHLSSIKRSGGGNVGGHPYPGFNEPYASRVERLDACFGAFIGSLKRRGLYDKSLIILTADHGDALGDEGRWGHAATIFPEIMHIPMITHLPKDLAARAKVDLEGPAFLIDLAPTLYQLLGQGPPRLDPLLGRPLASLGAQDPESWRKPEQMVVSSYGPAYGIIREGKSFFIGDGVNFRYYQYDLSTDPAGKNNLISAVSTKDGEQAVLAWLDRLNAFWGRK
jgi:arylsulfatase A-like enzyme